ncbi:uncharacterized protein [Montipora capricornis]|uniref:uncharacterized protein n=1 Tax=Montipora capricornis TaxID=246305 RepID=UPI0035F16E6A
MWETKVCFIAMVAMTSIFLVQTSKECKSTEDCGLKARCDSKLEKCACEQGYEGDPDVKCEREKCTKPGFQCHMYGFCHRETEHCRCMDSYIGDGVICEPLARTFRNLAKGRPASQISTKYDKAASRAVDGDRNVCSETEEGYKDPWWRVDLGTRVWINNILIASNWSLEEADIRIGDGDYVNQVTNKPCRQGLQIPSELWLYKCGQLMLGRYVYVRLLGNQVLKLCEVEVYSTYQPEDSHLEYLVPMPDNRRVMQQGRFMRSEDENHAHVDFLVGDWQFVTLVVPIKDMIINRVPKWENLKLRDYVIIPVEYKTSEDGNLTATCGNWDSAKEKKIYFLRGIIIKQSGLRYEVKTSYIPHKGKDNRRKIGIFTCSLEAMRLPVNDVCKLKEIKFCPSHSSCNTSYISTVFPPASFFCKCNPGYRNPHGKRPAEFHQFIGTHGRCDEEKIEHSISHSNQDLALGMNTDASTTNNYYGCSHKQCKEQPSWSWLAVDGSSDTCFLSMVEHNPWFVVNFTHYHPIGLIHVFRKASQGKENMKVYIANHGRFVRCAFFETDLAVWSTQCSTDETKPYAWGSAVKIQTDAKILQLCNVQVYTESYVNTISNHKTNEESKEEKVTDGNMRSCISAMIEYETSWRVELGFKLRVVVVFLGIEKDDTKEDPDKVFVKIEAGIGHDTKYCSDGKVTFLTDAKYFSCPNYLLADFVKVVLAKAKLCEVEIFHSQIINVAANRKFKKGHGKNEITSNLCCDQKIDVVFRSAMNEEWRLDFLAEVEITLLRFIMDVHYKPRDLEGLKIVMKRAKKSNQGRETTYSLEDPSAERVQSMKIFPLEVAKLLKLQRSGKDFKFLELEVYNAPFPDIDEDECLKGDVCQQNFICRNWPKQFSCECPTSGFKYVEEGEGKSQVKHCFDIDECKEMKNACPLANSHCKNTHGSHLCFCNEGYEAVYDMYNRLQKCADVDECKNPLFFNGCAKLRKCENLPGSFSCACVPGYETTDDNSVDMVCEDKNECNEESSCPVDHSYCINLKGSYNCTCKNGFKNLYDFKNRLKKCTDVNECKYPETFRCPERSKCVNLVGSYTCECAQGYEPAIKTKTRGTDIKCKDVNECKEGTHSCHVNSTCTNSPGSYWCQCAVGMKGDGRKACKALDPCTEDKKCKQKHQTCKEIKSSFLCDCVDGFISKSDHCKDKNECELDDTLCGSNSDCINTEGSYHCKCQPGYQEINGDATNCTDIDECATGEPCGDVATCKNTIGSYQCICFTKGFEYHDDEKRKGCFDIDECKSPDMCGPDEKCINQPATYKCSCKDGFESEDEDKLDCTDIDECFAYTYDCDSNAFCENSVGSYVCNCKDGYKKNSQGYCEEQCSEDCPENSECRNGKCHCLPGYAFGPYRECYAEEDFFVATGSGKSVYLPTTPFVIGQLLYLACTVRISLTAF